MRNVLRILPLLVVIGLFLPIRTEAIFDCTHQSVACALPAQGCNPCDANTTFYYCDGELQFIVINSCCSCI